MKTDYEFIDKMWRKGKSAGSKYWWLWFVPYSAIIVAVGSYIQNMS